MHLIIDSINSKAACFMISNTRLCTAKKGSMVSKMAKVITVIITIHISYLLSHFSKCFILI